MGKLALYDAVSEDMETNRNLKQPGHCGIAKYQDPSNSITEPLKLAIPALDRAPGREKSPSRMDRYSPRLWTASDT